MKIAFMGLNLMLSLNSIRSSLNGITDHLFMRLFTATLLAVFCFPVYAGLKLDLEIGTEYDSNVATDAADTNTGLGDVAHSYSIGLGYDAQLTPHWGLTSLYRLNHTQWLTYNEFDSQMHIGLIRLGYQKKKLSSDVSIIYADGRVDGDDFFKLNRISPALAYLINTHWYVRAQTDISKKTFSQFKPRDGETFAASLYLYRFIDRTRFYITAQAQFKHEHAKDDVYSYQGSMFKVQLKRDWQLLDYSVNSRLQGRYEQRQYEGLRPTINSARKDNRWRLSLDTRIHLTQQWQLKSSMQADWFTSNVAAADYRQKRIELGFAWKF